MKLEVTLLSEISQEMKDSYRMGSLHVESRELVHMDLYNETKHRSKQTF